MGANAGPDIVSDGLVLALDAADNNSFRGEPTENLVPSGQRTCSSNFTRTGHHVEVWSYALVTDVFGRADATKISITPTGNNSQPYADWGFTTHKSGGSQVGDVYTVSFDYKVTKNTTVPSLAVVYANGYKSPTSAAAASLSNETHTPLGDGWTRFSETATITTAGNTWWRFGMGSNNNETEVYVDNFQIELKSSRTRFVDGTRGTTVATGGGWADISGNSNHGEILNGTSTSNDNTVLGALDFDGTDDYIEIPYNSNLAPTSQITLEAFCYVLDNGGNWISVIQYPYSSASHTSPYFEWGLYLSMNDRRVHTRIDGLTANSSNYPNWNFNEWTHFVVTFSNQSVSFYVNGQNVGNDTVASTNITYNNNNNILISGNASRTELHEGKIAYCRVYNKALTAQEVLQNYNATKTRFGL